MVELKVLISNINLEEWRPFYAVLCATTDVRWALVCAQGGCWCPRSRFLFTMFFKLIFKRSTQQDRRVVKHKRLNQPHHKQQMCPKAHFYFKCFFFFLYHSACMSDLTCPILSSASFLSRVLSRSHKNSFKRVHLAQVKTFGHADWLCI